MKNLPNILTMCRIIMIPIMVIAYYLPWGHVVATVAFSIAGITDWFDGYLARKFNQSTPLGAFLDPVADKLIVSTALIIVLRTVPYVVLPIVIIIGREIVISALREWMAEVGNSGKVAVSYLGKVKTMVQMFGVGFLLASYPGGVLWIMVGAYILIYSAAILTLWSMYNYLRASWKSFFV